LHLTCSDASCIRSCQREDGSEDLKKGTQLLEVYAVEIQMYTEQRNNKKLKQLYHKVRGAPAAEHWLCDEQRLQLASLVASLSFKCVLNGQPPGQSQVFLLACLASAAAFLLLH
jgi:hypothetical protein